MNQEQAISVLLQVARVAQKNGILLLEEAEVVSQAVKLLTPKQEELAEEVAQEAETPVKSKAKK